MSFELETEKIQIHKSIKTAKLKTVVNSDVIVPDSKPDILNVLQVNAVSVISDKHIQKDNVLLSGHVNYVILYSGGDDNVEINSIEYRAPFSQTFSIPGVEDNIANYFISNVSHVESHIENSRKINLKSVISYECDVFETKNCSPITNILSDAEVPMKKQSINMLNVVACSENSIHISNEFSAPESVAEIDELLKTDLKISGQDFKVMNNKIIVKGHLHADSLYTSSGDIYHLENDIPFTEVIDVDGLNSDLSAEVRYYLGDSTVSLESDLEAVYIKLDATVNVLIKCFEEKATDVVCDTYFPGYLCELSKESTEIQSILCEETKTVSLTETMDISSKDPEIVKVYNLIAKPGIENTFIEDGKLTIRGYLDVKLLYLSENKNLPVYSADGQIPFTFLAETSKLPENSIIDTDLTLEHVSYLFKTNRQVEIRATVKARIRVFSQETYDLICDIKTDESSSGEKRPGIVIYFADKNEALWDIAKKYNTTLSSIQKINEIGNIEFLDSDKKLIIPKYVKIQ